MLANSTVVEVSFQSQPDLFWALRGGGSNFGIITKVAMSTFAKPASYYTFQGWGWTARQQVFKALSADTGAMPDGVSMIATTIAWHSISKRFVISERYVGDAITRATSTASYAPEPETRFGYCKTTLAMAEKMDRMNPDGYYNLFGSITVRNDAETYADIADVFREEVHPATKVDNIEFYTVFNPLTVRAISRMKKRGGNALGIEPKDGPLMGKLGRNASETYVC